MIKTWSIDLLITANKFFPTNNCSWSWLRQDRFNSAFLLDVNLDKHIKLETFHALFHFLHQNSKLAAKNENQNKISSCSDKRLRLLKNKKSSARVRVRKKLNIFFNRCWSFESKQADESWDGLRLESKRTCFVLFSDISMRLGWRGSLESDHSWHIRKKKLTYTEIHFWNKTLHYWETWVWNFKYWFKASKIKRYFEWEFYSLGFCAIFLDQLEIKDLKNLLLPVQVILSEVWNGFSVFTQTKWIIQKTVFEVLGKITLATKLELLAKVTFF